MPVDVKAQPPEPPSRLTDEEWAIWEEVTKAVRPGGSEILLETFCRAVATERRLATLLRQSDPANDLDFTNLVKSHRSESMLVAHLAGRLRLTARSTRDRETSKAAVKGPRPWGDAGLS